MPRCVVCNSFLPSFLVERMDYNDNDSYKCVFCIREKDVIEYVKNGKLKRLFKREAVNEYRKYINQIVDDNDKIKEIVKG